MTAMLGGSCAALGIAMLALAVATPAQAGTIGDDPTDCFTRTTGTVGRTNDLVNTSIADGPETGNYLYRIDQFDLTECSSAEVYGLTIVLKNPLDIPGPDDLSAATFGTLAAQMETDFPEFDHWGGWNVLPENTFALNPAGFHDASICVWIGEDVGAPGNLTDCIAGTALRIPLVDVTGEGMFFSIAVEDVLGPESSFGFFCGEPGECDDPLEIAVIAYSNVYGNTMGVYSHPEAVIGWRFVPTVPEPGLLALLGSGLAGLAWRRGRA